MTGVTKELILAELNKPLERATNVHTADAIRASLKVTDDHTKDEWLAFYKEMAYCIDDGLITFIYSFQEKDYRDSFQDYLDISFYLNKLKDKPIRITPAGFALLNQSHLGKMVDKLADTGDKQATVMFFLTLVIAALTFIQAGGTCTNGPCTLARLGILVGCGIIFLVIVWRFYGVYRLMPKGSRQN